MLCITPAMPPERITVTRDSAWPLGGGGGGVVPVSGGLEVAGVPGEVDGDADVGARGSIPPAAHAVSDRTRPAGISTPRPAALIH